MRGLTASMTTWSCSQRRIAIAAFTFGVGAFALCGGWALGDVFTQPDAGQYLDLAAGKPTMLPYASRQLGPLLVRALHAIFHLSLHTGFVIEATLALFVLLPITAFLIIESGAPRVLLVCAAGSFFWHQQVNALVMPDVLYAALLAIFMLWMHRGRFLAAAWMLLPLTLTRESTVLVLGCFLVAAWRSLSRRAVAAAVLATLAGVLIVRYLTANALPNAEKISPLVYLVAKLPWNFARNILGLDLWANLYPSCGVPRWQVPLHVGSLQAIGLCGYVPFMTYRTIAWGMCSFGLLPLLLVMLLLRRRTARSSASAELNPLARLSLLYGGISFLLAPMLGESTMRLFDYGWPMFLVGVPGLMSHLRMTFATGRAAMVFLVLHVMLSWSLLWLPGGRLLAFCVVLYAVAWVFCGPAFHDLHSASKTGP